jgi:hypothetical protein
VPGNPEQDNDPSGPNGAVTEVEERIPVVSAPMAQNHRDRRPAAANWFRRFGAWPNRCKIGRPTPVPTVAMDCGPLESRLDRLDALSRGGSGGDGSNPAVRSSRFD